MLYAENTAARFTKLLASGAPVPGGGGASAFVGSLGVSLASMVANLTTGKKKYAEFEPDIQRILNEADVLRQELLQLIDADAECFEPLSKAYSMNKNDPSFDEVMQAALRRACTAPMDIMIAASKAIELHQELAVKGSRLMLSDVGVGVLCCKTALMGASMNVLINLKSITGESYAAKLHTQMDELLEKYCTAADETYNYVLERLK